ncbi:MAG: hypothetical protein QE263_01480 [Vampirovibrionales bacterium]|nr:hypothetical protein [Vampirovibrionales bacterium]
MDYSTAGFQYGAPITGNPYGYNPNYQYNYHSGYPSNTGSNFSNAGYGFPNNTNLYGYNPSYQSNTSSNFNNTGYSVASYQQGVYGDLLANFMPPSQTMNGVRHAPSAMELFPELFVGVGSKLQNAYDPQGSGLGMSFAPGVSFNMGYHSMMSNRINQDFVTTGADGKEIRGASMSSFIDGMKKNTPDTHNVS